MQIELNEQEVTFLQEYFKAEIENETLSNFSKKTIINILTKLNEQ